MNNHLFPCRVQLVLSIATIGAVVACGGSSSEVATTGSPRPSDSLQPSGAPVSSPAETEVIGDCHSASVRPTSVVVTCGDAGYTVSEIEYTSWDAGRAEGSGVAVVTHGEHPGRYPVRFSLFRPGTFHGVRLFAALKVVYTGGRGPSGGNRETFDLTGNWYTSDLS